jgi:recombinational DNA repair protein RecT
MNNELVKIIENKKNEVWDARASYLNVSMESYFKRALITIATSDTLKDLIKSHQGAASVYEAIRKALVMGLQFGGSRPQAYITKRGNSAVLVPTFDGIKYILTTDPNPVLKDITIRPVYEKEIEKNFDIDFGNNTVTHKAFFGDDIGDFVGVYGIITDIRDVTKVFFMRKQEINRIRDNYSDGFKHMKGNSPWDKEYVQMAIKTAGKQFLKEYISRKEGLQYKDEMEAEQEEAFELETSDRMSNYMSEPVDITPETEPAPAKQKKEIKKNEKTDNNTDNNNNNDDDGKFF